MSDTIQYDVISPDGFSIDPLETYSSHEEAIKAFDEWKERFKKQGYYSSNQGKVSLDDLEYYCEIVPV